jgi:hypothetical protein
MADPPPGQVSTCRFGARAKKIKTKVRAPGPRLAAPCYINHSGAEPAFGTKSPIAYSDRT